MAKAEVSALLSDVRGSIESDVLSRVRSGLVVKQKPTYSFPVTPAMAVVNSYFLQVMAVYNSLTRPEVRQWNDYASTLTRRNELTGKRYAPTGQNTFVGLGCKFLQISPSGTVPRTPPTSTFDGDTITLSVALHGDLLAYTASGGNHAPAMTELLLQKLPTARRAPTGKFLSQAFVTYYAHGLVAYLEVESGIYIPAYRFVNPNTGQMTDLVVLPEVTVS